MRILLLLLLTVSNCYGASPETLILGPLELSRLDPALWQGDENLEVNYEARFENKITGDIISVSPHVLTDFEKRLGSDAEILGWLHQVKPGNWRALFFREIDLVFIFSYSGSEQVLESLMRSARLTDANTLSPCMRLGMIQNQFDGLRGEGKQEYAASLERELTLRLQNGDTHCDRPIRAVLKHVVRFLVPAGTRNLKD